MKRIFLTLCLCAALSGLLLPCRFERSNSDLRHEALTRTHGRKSPLVNSTSGNMTISSSPKPTRSWLPM